VTADMYVQDMAAFVKFVLNEVQRGSRIESIHGFVFEGDI
jgi:hypothetical protein